MSRALIQMVNTTNQSIAVNEIIPLGTITRRIGDEIDVNGNGIAVSGVGYYKISTNVVLTPEAAGNVTISLAKNGVIIPGATATGSVTTVGNTVTLPIDFIIRRGCCCDNIDNITCILTAGASTLNNIVIDIIKE